MNNQKIKKEKTFNAIIFLGLKETHTGIVHSFEDIRFICQKYVDRIGQCVNISNTEFVYTNGTEPGVRIEFIQYPRFPLFHDEIKSQAIELATELMYKFNQLRVSIVTSSDTYMISNKELLKELNLE